MFHLSRQFIQQQIGIQIFGLESHPYNPFLKKLKAEYRGR